MEVGFLNSNKNIDDLLINKNDTYSTENYPPIHDTAYSIKKEFAIDNSVPFIDYFDKLGAVKVLYRNERIDWCARHKTYALFDKNNRHILTFGIEGYNLFAAKYDFDKVGEVQEQHKVFNKSYNSYHHVECFYKSDSLLLQTIIPLLEKSEE